MKKADMESSSETEVTLVASGKSEALAPGMRIIGAAQAGKRLGRSVKTLEGWRYAGRGPRFVVDEVTGRFIGYSDKAIDDFIIAQEVQSTAEGRAQARRQRASQSAAHLRQALATL